MGGWLGFNATSGLLALITTIVGAAAGANLALLALDIAWDRSARPRTAMGGAEEGRLRAGEKARPAGAVQDAPDWT